MTNGSDKRTIIVHDIYGSASGFIQENWTDEEGNHQGGYSDGIGFSIRWQRGALNRGDLTAAPGRNGAFITEVIAACIGQLEYHNSGKFNCEENTKAIESLNAAVGHLTDRANRRKEENTLGKHND